MFPKEVFWQRRKQLHSIVDGGLLLFPGNDESAMNYRANTYHYRQDSSFLYFYGFNQPGLAGICDLDSGIDTLYGDDLTIEDIVWEGEKQSMKEKGSMVGVENIRSASAFGEDVKAAIKSGRMVHILPPYRGDGIIKLSEDIGCSVGEVNAYVSKAFIKAVVKLRSVKDQYEIKEIEKAADVAYIMHTTAMKMAFPGNFERELAGAIEGIALSHGGPVSFPVILSMDGQILHNHNHEKELVEGRMIITDAGAETSLGYASDITRTCPVGGKFSSKQKDIYQIVLDANINAIENSAPGVLNRDLHLGAARTIAGGLKDLGILSGNVDDIVAAGAHTLFFPHGLGHMLGLDVHDMEGLGENYVGYNESITRSEQFGLAYLRLGRELEPGFVITIEPGLYFIPTLIDIWKKENKHAEFINYSKVEEYLDFGGVRIEDDVLITDDGYKVFGTPIPKTIDEVEKTMNK